MSTASPCLTHITDKEHNTLIFHLIAIYIPHRETEGGGETDSGTDGHDHLDHLSHTHYQCQLSNSKPCTVDCTAEVTLWGNGSKRSWRKMTDGKREY